MKTKKILVCGLLAVIFALAFVGCEMEPEAVHEHEWGEWAVTTPATCVAKGVETSVCKLDSSHKETRDIAIDPDAHSYTTYNVTLPATCVATGEEQADCSLNSSHVKDTRTLAIDLVNGHDWDYDNVTTKTIVPTCLTKGSGTLNCKRNGCEDTNTDPDNIPALGHDFQNYEVTNAATCIAAGEKVATCARNGCDETDTQSIPIDLENGHDWEDTKTTFQPTETEDGVKAYVCKLESSHTKDEEFSGEYATGTAGLNFVLLSSNTAYRVSRGTATGDIVIPAYYRPDTDSEYLPVTTISNGTDSQSNNAFGGTSSNPNTTVTSIMFAAESPLTTISNSAFMNCRNLTNITIPEGVTSISDYAFSYCSNLTSITIPAGVTTIGTRAFESSGLTSIIIPEGVTTIGQRAFYLCTSLTSVTIPSSVTTIDGSAFQSSGLTSIIIPEGVTTIGQSAFTSCTSLTSIIVDANNPNFSGQGGILYNKSKTELLAYPSASGDITIPAGVTTIGRNAFENRSGLTSVTIPEGVTTIVEQAFQRCTGLTSITIPVSVTDIGGYAFFNCTNLASVTFAGTIASSSFYYEPDIPSFYVFLGDLRDKFYATDSANGTPGTYTTTAPVSSSSVWTKQP